MAEKSKGTHPSKEIGRQQIWGPSPPELGPDSDASPPPVITLGGVENEILAKSYPGKKRYPRSMVLVSGGPAQDPAREMRSLLIKAAIFAASLFLLFGFVFGFTPMRGAGMYPSLKDGDLLLYYRLGGLSQLGQVVLYRAEDQERVGRIVAVAGDTVSFSESGQFLLNGAVQQEAVFYPSFASDLAAYPLKIPEGSVFILGDGRENSLDSRDFGPIAIKEIKGRAITLFRRRQI
ncbi:MAG: signal peptidase I [Christensenellaceae bacterium]|jgi:signal peptidase I|nr:signal peptidase I [Christensenellaceae bacterium]